MKTIKIAYQELKNKLQVAEPAREAQIILEYVLNIDASELISNEDTILTTNQTSKIFAICEKRNDKRIPLAYLLEEAFFRDLKLFVNNDVLIPRPETELLIDLVLNEIKSRKISQPTILDLGTGSGCIAISLKRALPAAKVFASDISQSALNVAAINAKRYDCKIDFVLGDFLDPFLNLSSSPIALPIIKGKPPYFDVIVSNPPYVSAEEYEHLEPELYHEPKHALVGFPFEHIKKQSRTLIKKNGFLVCEFGNQQTKKLEEIFPQAQFFQDLEKHDRFFIWNPVYKSVPGFKFPFR